MGSSTECSHKQPTGSDRTAVDHFAEQTKKELVRRYSLQLLY